jgi:hypothetical protein
MCAQGEKEASVLLLGVHPATPSLLMRSSEGEKVKRRYADEGRIVRTSSELVDADSKK